ncbi:hypothetical protein Tco_0195663 [Tanacetum coccineum]
MNARGKAAATLFASTKRGRRVMAAPAVSVSTNSPEESFEDTIKIGVDVIYPVPVTLAIFPRWEDIEELRALRERERERADIAKTERITLRARVRSLEVVETWLHGIVRDERERPVRGLSASWVWFSRSYRVSGA